MSRALSCACALVLAGCGAGFQRFSDRAPVWVDLDQTPFTPPPEEYISPFAWDGADQMFFRPISRVLAVDPGGEAANVNALDEVPNSSWWTNRLGLRHMSREELFTGGCENEPPLDPSLAPWTIVSAKPNGANPGFIIEDTTGRKFVIKFEDGDIQPERPTGADVIVSRIYYAAGYFAPCNRIVEFDRSILTIREGTTYEHDGDDVPLTMDVIRATLDRGTILADGRQRASSSLFVQGRPIGPFRYEGTRSDDPNDVIPHEDRRELRGGRVLAAWLNHFDSREQNTLAAFITTDEESGAGYVRHYYIDFGDCFGSEWPADGTTRRLGHSSYLDIPDVAADFITLGIPRRPWQRNRWGRTGRVFGYYDIDTFEPEDWEGGYPNPAFMRMSERDGAWMARILARFDDERIRTLVELGRFARPLVRDELVRLLIGRRDKVLLRYFRQISPLSFPRVENDEVCLTDLAVIGGVADQAGSIYGARVFVADGDDAVHLPGARPRLAAPDTVCVGLPPETPSTAYAVVDVLARRGETDEIAAPARVHLVLDGGEMRVVGLERPYDRDDP
jgi:hypothetical protein